jgi:hypothetical protein
MVSATSGGTFSGNVTHSGTVTVDDTTDSSSTTTGSIQTDGGVGIAKKLYVGTDLDVDGTSNLDVVDIDGALTQDGGAVFNEAGASVDFRVEGDTNTNLLLVDGSADRVGIGISPSFNVQIDKSSTDTTLTDLTDAQLVLSNTGTATTNQHVKLGFRFQDGSVNGQAMIAAVRESNSARTSSLRFYSAPSSDGDPDERLSISGDGDVTVSTGNLVMGTAGKGIDFAFATNDSEMTSELLDDYEEGLATMAFSPGAGSITIASSYEKLSYTKIGRVVHMNGQIAANGISGLGSGNTLQITGLPFAAVNLDDAAGRAAWFVPYDAGGTITQGNEIFAFINEGGSVINIYEQNTAGASNKAEMIGANTSLYFSFTYNTTS